MFICCIADPNLIHIDHGLQAICRLAVMIPIIALITDEWDVYITGAVDTDETDCAE